MPAPRVKSRCAIVTRRRARMLQRTRLAIVCDPDPSAGASLVHAFDRRSSTSGGSACSAVWMLGPPSRDELPSLVALCRGHFRHDTVPGCARPSFSAVDRKLTPHQCQYEVLRQAVAFQMHLAQKRLRRRLALQSGAVVPLCGRYCCPGGRLCLRGKDRRGRLANSRRRVRPAAAKSSTRRHNLRY